MSTAASFSFLFQDIISTEAFDTTFVRQNEVEPCNEKGFRDENRAFECGVTAYDGGFRVSWGRDKASFGFASQ